VTDLLTRSKNINFATQGVHTSPVHDYLASCDAVGTIKANKMELPYFEKKRALGWTGSYATLESMSLSPEGAVSFRAQPGPFPGKSKPRRASAAADAAPASKDANPPATPGAASDEPSGKKKGRPKGSTKEELKARKAQKQAEAAAKKALAAQLKAEKAAQKAAEKEAKLAAKKAGAKAAAATKKVAAVAAAGKKVFEFPDPNLAIHRIRWNPNAFAASWLAYGCRVGLVRVKVIPGV
jgi:hypothetical protein